MMRIGDAVGKYTFVTIICLGLASVLYASGDRDKGAAPRDVTMVGKVVDLQSFMTGKYESSDQVKSTRDSIRAGVPAALETEEGIVILGQGMKGAARTLTPLAFQVVEAKGKLYEKHGLKYLDLSSAAVAKKSPEAESEVEEDDWGFDDSEGDEDSEPEDEGEWEP